MLHSLRFRLLLAMALVVLATVGTVALFTSRTTSSEFARYLRSDAQRNQRMVSDLISAYRGDPSPDNLANLVKQLAENSGEHIIVADHTGSVLADSEGKLVGQTLNFPPPRPGVFFNQVVGGEAPMIPITSALGTTMTGPITSTSGIVAATEPTLFITQALTVPVGAESTYVQAGDTIAWAPFFVPLASGAVGVAGVGGTGEQSVTASLAGDIIVARIPSAEGGRPERGFLSSVNQQLLLAVTGVGLAALLLTWVLSRRILGPVEALTAAAGKLEKGDLTQRVEVSSKDEIGELAHAFNSMADGLERLEQLRRNMVTDVAHELRTPLSNIQGYLEAIRDGVVNPGPALINSLHEEALLLSRLVDDLQELELAEAGKLRLQLSQQAPREMVEKAVLALHPATSEREIGVSTYIAPNLPTVEADPERIGQVLRNLLNNALTHTPWGGEIRVAARLVGEEVEFSVKNYGPGISPNHMPYLFERFYRADNSRSRATGGAGLGLSIVKHLINLHGGRVWAESVPGEGATFYFTLPTAPRPEPVPLSVPTSTETLTPQ
jgi:signal transduction histidine kinase